MEAIKEQPIPKHIARLVTIGGFVEAWTELVAFHDTYEEAYEALERNYCFHYGCRKYSDYNSFRLQRDRYYKGLTKEKQAD